MEVYDLLWKRTDGKEGKWKWEKVGVLIKKDNQSVLVKLNTIPVGPNWDGWLRAKPTANVETQQ